MSAPGSALLVARRGRPADLDLSGIHISWQSSSGVQSSGEMTIDQGLQWAAIEDLDETKSYQFHVAAVDRSGNESTGTDWNWTPVHYLGAEAVMPITDLQLQSASAAQLHITWTDPSVTADLSKLVVSWSAAEGQALPATTVEVTLGTESYTVSGLQASTVYNIAVMSENYEGKRSQAVLLQAGTTAVGGSSSGGSGTGGSTGTTSPVDPVDQTVVDWLISSADQNQTFQAFTGQLTLTVPKNAFSASTVLHAKESSVDAVELPDGYTGMSPIFSLNLGESASAADLLLSLQYQKELASDMDVRRLGIYKRDPDSEQGWVYVDGIVNASDGSIESTITESGDYAVMLFDHPFEDLMKHWSREELDVLISRHAVRGVSETRFEPDRSITRAETVALFMQVLQASGLSNSAQSEGAQELPSSTAPDSSSAIFTDVAPNAWYASAVNDAAQLGLITGSEGKFRPQDPITREEFAVILLRYYERFGTGPIVTSDDHAIVSFEDAATSSVWAIDALNVAVSQQWMRGVGSSQLAPYKVTTRAEAAVMLLRMLTSLGQIVK